MKVFLAMTTISAIMALNIICVTYNSVWQFKPRIIHRYKIVTYSSSYSPCGALELDSEVFYIDTTHIQ